eukprot:1757284-Prymnesium_polylepis.1
MTRKLDVGLAIVEYRNLLTEPTMKECARRSTRARATVASPHVLRLRTRTRATVASRHARPRHRCFARTPAPPL